MRKVFIAAAAALVLFTVGAFAINLTVRTEDVASGSNDVAACAQGVDVDFTTQYVTASNDWQVTNVIVSFYANTTTGTLSTDCNGRDATVAIHGAAATPVQVTGTPITAGKITIPVPAGTFVNGITRASVLVDGATLQVNNINHN